MNEAKDTAMALNVRLKPIEKSNLAHLANYTTVGVAQGILYIASALLSPLY